MLYVYIVTCAPRRLLLLLIDSMLDECTCLCLCVTTDAILRIFCLLFHRSERHYPSLFLSFRLHTSVCLYLYLCCACSRSIKSDQISIHFTLILLSNSLLIVLSHSHCSELNECMTHGLNSETEIHCPLYIFKSVQYDICNTMKQSFHNGHIDVHLYIATSHLNDESNDKYFREEKCAFLKKINEFVFKIKFASRKKTEHINEKPKKTNLNLK